MPLFEKVVDRKGFNLAGHLELFDARREEKGRV